VVAFLTQLPVIILPMLIRGLSGFSNKGIFYNPNSLGISMAMLFSFIFAIFLGDIFSKRKLSFLKISIYFILIIGSILLLLLSLSRTSIISCMLLSLILLMIPVYKLFILSYDKMKIHMLKRFILLLLMFVFVIVILMKIDSYTELSSNLFIKFEYTMEHGDLLQKRGDIWSLTFSEWTLFGHGRKYFKEIYEIGAHNTFISLLGQFGLLPTIIFVLFIIWAIKNCFLFSMKQIGENIFSFLPISQVLIFSLLSIGEGTMMTLCMYTLFATLGAINYGKNGIIILKI